MVSIILPVHNAERFVLQALASIHSQIYTAYEIVVIDGGSTDGTATLIRKADKVRFITQPGSGLADAWNAGLAAANGEYICFIDSDDLWPPYKLDIQVAYLEQHPEIEYVVGFVTYFVEPGCQPPPQMRAEIFSGAHVGYMPGTLMARRGLFRRLGGFGAEWEITPDIEWVARMQAEDVPRAVLPQVLLNKRVHETNLSTVAGPALIKRELLRLLKSSLDRRRASHEPDRAR